MVKGGGETNETEKIYLYGAISGAGNKLPLYQYWRNRSKWTGRGTDYNAGVR